jgi:DNA-binding transcriptional LysR family regulator
MDRLDELTVLVAVLDGGSLAAAARRLRRSPAAITRALAALEERAGARLIERTTRRLRATEAGQVLAGQARAILATYGEAMREPGETKHLRGTLRVTAPLLFGRRHITPIVGGFLDAHPDLRVDLVLADRNLDLMEDEIDVAVRIGRLADSSMVARKVGEVRRMLVASPAYLAAHGTPRAPGDLAGHQVIFTSARPGPLEWRLRQAGRDIPVRLAPRLIVNEVEATLMAARDGRGVAWALSYQVADDLDAGSLVRLLPHNEPAPYPVHLVVPGGRHMPPRARLFLDHAAPLLARLDVLRPPA